MLFEETYLKYKDKDRWKFNPSRRKMYQADSKHKKVGVAILNQIK